MHRSLAILKNPLVVLGSIAVGVFIGLNFKDLSLVLAPFGQMYLYLLQMCVIPILLTSIVASTGKLVIQSDIKLLKKIIFYFFVSIISIGIFGVLVGIISQPGAGFSQENKEIMGEYIKSSALAEDSEELEVEIFGEIEEEEYKESPLISFIISIVPKNIFLSLSTGRAMEVVFFTIILGISIGILRNDDSNNILSMSSSLFISFQKIMNTVIYFLPIGLMLLVANQVRELGLSLIYPMLKLIVVFYVAGAIVVFLNIFIIKTKSKSSYSKTLEAVGESMTIAFFTRNSLAAIPASVKGLDQTLGFERSTCNLLIPLGITLGRYGNIFYFAICSMFVVQLYEIDYGIIEIGIVLIGSILAGTATSGATGFSTIPLITIVLAPLGIPAEVALLLLFAIDTIVDPMRTLLIVHTNLATTSLVANLYPEADKRKGNIYQDTIV